MRDGIADVHHLGLTALEVQFIKVNPLTRVVLDEEVGKTPRELPLQLVVETGSGGHDPVGPEIARLNEPLKKRSTVTTLTWSLAKDYADLAQTRALARALDVALTLHAPYYVDFFGSPEAHARSKRQIQWAALLADGLGARLAVTHLGFYGGGERGESIAELTKIAGELADWMKGFGRGGVRLGVEPSGHPDVFGSRDEVLELAARVKGVVPVLNIPHLAARERTTFADAASLRPVIDSFVAASNGELFLNFSGMEAYGSGEFRLTPIKRGQVRFDPLAEVLADRDYDLTVISSSPLLEHDAMYMKLLYERALAKRWTKRHAAPPAPPATAAAPAGLPKKVAPRKVAPKPKSPRRASTPSKKHARSRARR